MKNDRVEGALLIDTRPTADYARGHVPGALNVPFGRSFATYAGSLVPYDRDLALVVADPTPARVAALVAGAVSIGLDRVVGVADATVLDAWTGKGRRLGRVEQLTAAELASNRAGRFIVDVRKTSEWEGGHVPGATLLPLPELARRLDEIPAGSDVVVMCQGGGRSAVAASLLQARGVKVTNLVGGFSQWEGSGGEVER